MPLSVDEVQHLAQLARLELSTEEIERYSRNLSSILNYVAKLQELSVPSSREARSAVQLRPDEVRPWPQAHDLINLSPSQAEGSVAVPPVFEDRE